MSDRYPFCDDKTLITHDVNVVWNEQVAVPSSLNFSNVTDCTLTDSINESYATAVEDNETQYLSILETTNDVTLESLHNLTFGTPKIVTEENLELNDENAMDSLNLSGVNIGDQQVVIFSIEGSDDLYGIQLAQDEEGNIQRYQFKFRTTDDGQLEAIPESIQLLPGEEEIQQNVEGNQTLIEATENEETEIQESHVIFQEESDVQETRIYLQEQEDEVTTEELVQVGHDKENMRIIIKREPRQRTVHLPDHISNEQEYANYTEKIENMEGIQDDLHYEETETENPEEDHYEEETIDVKAGILEESLALRNTTASHNIKQEVHQEDSQDQATLGEEQETEEYHIYEQEEDTDQTNYKESHAQDEDDDEDDDTFVEHNIEGHVEVHVSNHYEAVEVDGLEETVLEYQQYGSDEIHPIYEQTDTTGSQNLDQTRDSRHYEQLFIQENHIGQQGEVKSTEVQLSNLNEDQEEEEVEEGEQETEEQFVTETGTENDSDNDDYQIVEGLHITAEGDIGDDSISIPFQEPETILQEVMEKPPSIERANILRQTPILNGIKEVKTKNKTIVYYVVPHLEKENVNSLPVNNTTTFRSLKTTNPRSILKSSFLEVIEEPEINSVVDERLDKRFARSKEAVQARLFNNFISKTTIPHAPVRHTRLPRKQEIKPVDTRRDEEIIVQEVMVSSKGFEESVEEKLKNKDKLEITGYVVLSDSDDDYDPKQGNKKKKKHKKHKRVVDMCDSEDSNISIIEILQSDEEKEEDERKEKEDNRRGRGRPRKSIDIKDANENTKRRRGRPSKSSQNQSDSEESPPKKSRTESDEGESDSTKKEIKCPHCIKTFPSQNSLNTHIQHHNLENSMRNSQANKASVKNTTVVYRHKCDSCQMSFKNSILLKRHVCQKQIPKINKRLDCNLCKKSFPDNMTLNVHKRIHVKENLVKTTTVVKVSPKKYLPKASTSQFKSPQKPKGRRSTLKCKECSRLCFSQESLNLHEKTHKKFTCPTCSVTFPSKLLLDTHIRVSCVKTASPHNRRLSYKIKKTFVQTPRRKTGQFSQNTLTPGNNIMNVSTMNNSILDLKLECESCGERFKMFQDKFKHQVKMHGLKTPDESILVERKKLLHKPRNPHGGIPSREGMRRVFADIKSKIALITSTENTN